MWQSIAIKGKLVVGTVLQIDYLYTITISFNDCELKNLQDTTEEVLTPK